MLRFRVLGPLEVWTGQDWSGIGAPKWRALLAVLLLSQGQAVSTDRLIAELWGDRPPDRAANLVSIYVLRLRRVIGDRDGHLLTTRAPGYQLPLQPGELDAEQFQALAGQGRKALAQGDFRAAADVLAEALGLWRGRALADVPPFALVTAEAERLEESRLTTLELRIEADLGCGMHAQLVPELRRLLSDQPLREGLWGLLMQALDAAGRHAEALAAYGQAREVIAGELGVDPGPELQRLYQALLTVDLVPRQQRGASTRAAAAAIGASAQPAGAPAARSAAVPAAPPAAVPATPAAASHDGEMPAGRVPRRPGAGSSLRRVPAQLPADVADFTGREANLEQLCAAMSEVERRDNPAVAVAVVAGAPGLGKTALAIHAAHALRRDYPDGQLYVSLRGGSEQPVPPDEVLARFLRDLGVDGARIPVDAEERAALYRTRLAERQMLVVLDDARNAAQVRPLLPGTGSCAVIVTSRHRLSDLAGSRLIDLDVLDDAEATELFTRIVGAERADAEPDAVRDVVAICAGLPLAIRIAGARLAARRGWKIRALANRLADQRRRIDELIAGDLAVRACFQVSFDALARGKSGGGADPASLFRMLGVWQGPSIGLNGAAALVGQPEALVGDSLEVLVDAHLLESPAPDRYRLHDLLRDYAAERAEADEPQAADDAMRRVLSWYLLTADMAASVVAPHREQVPLDPADPGGEPLVFATAEQALAWCQQERSNLVAATRQAASRGLHDIAWKLPAVMKNGFDRLGYRAEWLATHRVALSSVRELGDRPGEARILNNLGMVLGQMHLHEAIGYFDQALTIYRDIGDRRDEALAANNQAFCYLALGRYDEAVTALLRALELQREAGRRYGEGVALCNLVEAYVELGRYDEAIASSQEALAVIREVGSVRDEGYALCNLGRAHLELGRSAQAADLFQQALAIHRAAGNRYGEAQVLQQLGNVHARAGRTTEALEASVRARSLFESIGEDMRVEEISAQLEELGAENGGPLSGASAADMTGLDV
jgi:DNA-binding SARP family transcriptional activator/Tfp pilus assembly protein PilF